MLVHNFGFSNLAGFVTVYTFKGVWVVLTSQKLESTTYKIWLTPHHCSCHFRVHDAMAKNSHTRFGEKEGEENFKVGIRKGGFAPGNDDATSHFLTYLLTPCRMMSFP